jgi:hypothetical protein
MRHRVPSHFNWTVPHRRQRYYSCCSDKAGLIRALCPVPSDDVLCLYCVLTRLYALKRAGNSFNCAVLSLQRRTWVASENCFSAAGSGKVENSHCSWILCMWYDRDSDIVQVTCGLSMWRFAGVISYHQAVCRNWSCLWFRPAPRVWQMMMWPGIQIDVADCRRSVHPVTEGIAFASECFNNMEVEAVVFLRRHGSLYFQ